MIEDSSRIKEVKTGWRKRNGRKKKRKTRKKNGNFPKIAAHTCLFVFTY
jgi:hypothetical protein